MFVFVAYFICLTIVFSITAYKDSGKASLLFRSGVFLKLIIASIIIYVTLLLGLLEILKESALTVIISGLGGFTIAKSMNKFPKSDED